MDGCCLDSRNEAGKEAEWRVFKQCSFSGSFNLCFLCAWDHLNNNLCKSITWCKDCLVQHDVLSVRRVCSWFRILAPGNHERWRCDSGYSFTFLSRFNQEHLERIGSQASCIDYIRAQHSSCSPWWYRSISDIGAIWCYGGPSFQWGMKHMDLLIPFENTPAACKTAKLHSNIETTGYT